jgi:hypothetical protein
MEMVCERSVSAAHPRISAHSGGALGHFGNFRARSGPRRKSRIFLFQVLFPAGRAGSGDGGFSLAAANQLLELVAAGFAKVFVDRHIALLLQKAQAKGLLYKGLACVE